MTVRYLKKPRVFADFQMDRHGMIEASAGTGKTYTLKHILLAALLEKGCRISEILVVTFTEKATAEMKSEIRSFLEEVLSGVSTSAEPPTDADAWTIDNAARARIRDALGEFETANIKTMHSFCHGVLTELAFSGDRPLEQEIVDGPAAFAEASLEALRSRITIDKDLENALRGLKADLTLSTLLETLEALRGKRGEYGFAATEFAEIKERFLLEDCPQLLSADTADLVDAFDKKKQAKTLDGKRAAIGIWAQSELEKSRGEADAGIDLGKPAPLELFENFNYLANYKSDTEFSDLLGRVAEFRDWLVPPRTYDAEKLMLEVEAEFRDQKRSRGQYDFDDMIQAVADIVAVQPDGSLVKTLRQRFRQVLIDEFQDTDATQWGLFKTIFYDSNKAHVLHAVGDPKQAIYGFRGADVATYLKARETFSSDGFPVAGLGQNFRSQPQLVEVLNAIFDQGVAKPFFSGAIQYPKALESAARTKSLCRDDKTMSACCLIRMDDATLDPLDCLGHYIGREITGLLGPSRRQSPASIGDPAEGGRHLVAGDIQILVRTNARAKQMAAILDETGIPWVISSDQALFESPDALEVLDLLEAIFAPQDEAKLLRAATGEFLNGAIEDLDRHRAGGGTSSAWPLISHWSQRYEERGFAALVAAILEDSALFPRLILEGREGASLSIYRRVFEVLTKESLNGDWDSATLLYQLRRFTQGEAHPVESVDNTQPHAVAASAVNIMTMHKSKGLEAPVVFFFDLFSGSFKSPAQTFDFAGKRRIVVGKRSDLSSRQALALDESERQESERLFYVGLTRAQCRLYLPWWEDLESAKKLGHYQYVADRLDAMALGPKAKSQPDLWEIAEVDVHERIEDQVTPTDWSQWTPPATVKAESATGLAQRFSNLRRRHESLALESYSSLKRQAELTGAPAPRPLVRKPDGRKIDLPPGRLTGLFLHALFEDWGFDDVIAASSAAELESDDALRRHAERRARQYSLDASVVTPAIELLHRVLNCPLAVGDPAAFDSPPLIGGMQVVAKELDFSLTLDRRDQSSTEPLAFLRGYIDVVLEHEGRWFIVDWKSDYLEDYSPPALDRVIADNYALQAKIYGHATLRLLKIENASQYEEKFGGLVYVFLRGAGLDPGAPESGIWFDRPSFETATSWAEDIENLVGGKESI